MRGMQLCRRLKTAVILILTCLHGLAQNIQDSLKNTQLESVVVTATRNERSLSGIPIAISVVDAAALKTMGSVRLQDALAEQTGLVIVPQINAQGNGLQLQGFNPDYTLILLDGEPLIGRNTGSLELSRITTGNIRQIEIVKGPASSLYGSEALAGVVNIITSRPSQSETEVNIRTGSNATTDFSGRVSLVGSKTRSSIFANRYETAGYDLSPKNFGKTVSPFTNFTLQPKFSWKISDDTELTISTRYFHETQQFAFDVKSGETNTRTSGDGTIKDWSVNSNLSMKLAPMVKGSFRVYATFFQTETDLRRNDGKELFYQDNFRQHFIRPEWVTTWAPTSSHTITTGVGFIQEQVNTSRYGDMNARSQSTGYAFLQDEWNPGPKASLVSGIRLDRNTVFGSQISPKLSGSFKISERLLIKASGGAGFKAPDFRQLYFNFTNSAAGGYAVLGSEIIKSKLTELESTGQIESYLFDPEKLERIKAESSVSMNVGFDYKKERWSGYANFFHNEIKNLIETQAVATSTSGQAIYTYRNINAAFTRGIESGLQFKLTPALNLSAGHQLLYAIDRVVLEEVKNGNLFFRDPETLVTSRLNTRDYFGLQNRSRHSGNLKLMFKNQTGWESSLRTIWRSRFGVGDIRGNIQGETIPPSDINSNGILDRYDRFVSGYCLLNFSIAKEFQNGIRLQTGIDNLLNYREPIYIPNMPGRLFYFSAGWRWKEKLINKP